jgi:nicotinate phosphoribosyltransferase
MGSRPQNTVFLWTGTLFSAGSSTFTPIFVDGKQVYELPTLDEIRNYCKQQLDTLWDEVKRFEYPHKYYVDLSPALWQVRHNLLDRHDFTD